MPTVFVHKGYRVGFYSYDPGERMLLHVFKAVSECEVAGGFVVRLEPGF